MPLWVFFPYCQGYHLNSLYMNTPASAPRNNRILIIDDNAAIHADIRKILCPQQSQGAASLESLEAELLGTAPSARPRNQPVFTVDSAYQGKEGLDLVQRAVAAGQPYA